MTTSKKSGVRAIRAFMGLFLVAAGGGYASLQGADDGQRRFEFSQPHMGVLFKLSFYGDDEAAANLAAAKAFDEIARLDGLFSDYKPESELSRLSRASPTERSVSVSGDMWSILATSMRLSEQSAGAFDVTVGPYVRLWRRARRQRMLPTSSRLARARASVGYEKIVLVEPARAVMLNSPDMRLDLGGIAKGYAIDGALARLSEAGFPQALVDGGGDIAMGASPPARDGWRVGTVTIQDDGRPECFLSLKGCAVAASGDLYQFVEIDGKRYSHIVDPRTGIGITQRVNVTVFAPDCTLADGLATALSVLNLDEGRRLLRDYPKVAAVVAGLDGDDVSISVIGASDLYGLDELEGSLAAERH